MMRTASFLAALSLAACGTDTIDAEVLPAAQNALPQTFTLDMTDPLIPGDPVSVSITGGPPNVNITLVQTDGQIAPGICPPQLSGECMDITGGPSGYNVLPLPLRTDANGDAVFNGTLPAGIPQPQDWVFQAVHVGTLTASTPIARTVGFAPCVDDAFEDDDDPTTANAITAGSTTSATACPGDSDWYSFSGLAGEVFSGDIAYDTTGGDVDGNMYDDAGTLLSAADFSFTTPDPFDDADIPADGTYYIEAFIDPAQPFTNGSAYDLTFDLVTPADCVVDVYEPNDDSTVAVPLTAGSYTGLGACYYVGGTPEDRVDWYAVDVTAGNTLTADIFFTDAEGDTDLYLFDFMQTNADIDIDFLARGYTTTDDEQVTTDVTVDGTYYIAVRLFSDAGAGVRDGNDYDLTISIDPTPPPAP